MLVLSRKVGESLMIDDVEIILVRIHGKSRVRLGIIAPTRVRVIRKETVGKEKQHENDLEVPNI